MSLKISILVRSNDMEQLAIVSKEVVEALKKAGIEPAAKMMGKYITVYYFNDTSQTRQVVDRFFKKNN